MTRRSNVNVRLAVISGMILIISSILNIVTPAYYEIFNAIKPITIMQYSCFLFFACGLLLTKKYFMRFNKKELDVIMVIAFLFLMATAFEALWAFFYWFSIYSKNSAIDTISLDMIYYVPRNTKFYSEFLLNFSSKKNFLFLFMSIYFTYFIKIVRGEKW